MQTKTLAQLKKDLKTGVYITTVSNSIKEGKIKRVGIKRIIGYTDTTGIYIKHLEGQSENNGKGSYLPFPKASELTYIGDTFTIKDCWGEITYKLN